MMQMNWPVSRNTVLKMLLAGASIALSQAPAYAQDAAEAAAEAPSEDEIVVTARRRAESLLDVPVAVSVLGAADINRYGATDLGRIGQMVPQLTIARNATAGTGAIFSIRGIGSPAADPGLEQTIAVNMDGFQISRGSIVTAGLFDLQQVEVLKGPQALFFGKNSPGGVISLRSADPTRDFTASAKVGYEFHADEVYSEAHVSGPLSDTLGIRVAGRFSKMQGYLHNDAVAGPNPINAAYPLPGGADRYPDARSLAGRVTLKWDPTSDFSATLKVLASNYKDGGFTGSAQVIRCAPGRNHPTTLGVEDVNADCVANGRKTASNLPVSVVDGFRYANGGVLYSKSNDLLITLGMNYDLGAISIQSNTGYYRNRLTSFDNFDFTSFMTRPSNNLEKSDYFAQELRFVTDLDGGLNFAGGLFYETFDRDARTLGSLTINAPDPRNGYRNSWDRDAYNEGKTFSAFGQVIWKPTEQLEVAAGARYTKENREVELVHSFIHPAAPQAIFLPEGRLLSGKFKDDDISPEATITYRPSRELSFYAAFKTGYKSGGFSNAAILGPNTTIANYAIGAEKARGGELGFKSEFANGLNLNATVFYYKYKDLQVSAFDGIASFFVRNAATATTKGVELDARYEVSRDFTINGALSYNDAKFSNYQGAPCFLGQTAAEGCVSARQDLSGFALSRAPEFVASGGFNYEGDLSGAWRFGLSGEAKYSSSFRTQDDGTPWAVQGDFVKINAGVRVFTENMEFALLGRNLTNEYTVSISNTKTAGQRGELWGVIDRPREVALQATYRF